MHIVVCGRDVFVAEQVTNADEVAGALRELGREAVSEVIGADLRGALGLETSGWARVAPGRTNAVWTLTRRRLGQSAAPPYTLMDMANDAIGLMDALDLPSAHLVGASMGGMIAQLCAIHHRGRVRSLTSMMSSTGDRDLPKPAWRARYFDEEEIRAYFARVVARSADRTGVPRQALALLCAGSRRRALSQLKVPALVLHGLDDILLPPAHGVRTADAIPNAKLQLIPKLGHDLPRPMWSDLSSRIVYHIGS